MQIRCERGHKASLLCFGIITSARSLFQYSSAGFHSHMEIYPTQETREIALTRCVRNPKTNSEAPYYMD
jgi:hypothetical protein